MNNEPLHLRSRGRHDNLGATGCCSWIINYLKKYEERKLPTVNLGSYE
ncbi:hypothetical protein M1N87_01000 [Dehalococcoidia bacterium]|nr:hypothetical protein [Dehalococcoidia bacterium]